MSKNKKSQKTLRIRYGSRLDPILKKLFNYAKNDGINLPISNYPEKNEILKKISDYDRSIQKFDFNFINSIENIVRLHYKLNVVDIFLVGYIHPSISTPPIISSHYTEDEFITVLVHELIHVLLSDNQEGLNFSNYLSVAFPELSEQTKIHILVNAVICEFYKKVMHKEAILVNIKSKDSEKPNYRDAWKIVESNGSQKILTDFVEFNNNSLKGSYK